jgi:hypothetical protein
MEATAMSEAPDRVTVVVVHGTFSGQAADRVPRWYEPGQDFCRQLDAELESRGSAARCWRHLEAGEAHFHWDGANDWLSRRRAAEQLRQQVRELIAKGWQVHLVGHSHGGNVVFDAITNDVGHVEDWFSGRIALLGTPLYQPSTAKRKRQERLRTRWWAVSLLAWPLLIIWSARQVDVRAAFALGAATEWWAMFFGVVLVIAIAVLLVRAFRYWQFRSDLFGLLPAALLPRPVAVKASMRRSPAFLLINSRSDEAYKSLSALPLEDNPLRARGDRPKWYSPATLGAVFSAGRERLALLLGGVLDTGRPGAVLAAGALGVAAWLLWLPGLRHLSAAPVQADSASLAFWVVLTTMAVAAVALDRFLFLPGIVVTETLPALGTALKGYLSLALDATIRRWVWESTQSFALGQNGAPVSVADIDVRLAFSGADAEDCVYLELPAAVVTRVVDSQKGRLGEIQEILYRKAVSWSPSGLREALEGSDFPLVHTAYYREPECVQKVAGWICEPMTEELDGRTRRLTTAARGAPAGGLQNMVLEEVESPNAYRSHVDELQTKFAPPGSEWAPPQAVGRPMGPAPP